MRIINEIGINSDIKYLRKEARKTDTWKNGKTRGFLAWYLEYNKTDLPYNSDIKLIQPYLVDGKEYTESIVY